MAADFKVKVTLPFTTGLATDVAVNTFAFHDPGIHNLLDLVTDIENFYTVQPVGPLNPNKLSNFLASFVSRSLDACRIDVYNRANPPNSPPEVTSTFTLAAAVGADDYPGEVAAALTIDNGPPVTHRNRGRIFIGALNTTAAQELAGAGTPLIVSTNFVDNVLQLASDLKAAALIDGFEWQIWSEANGAGLEVNRASVDNALDTMRSRGQKSTSRVYTNV